MRKKMKILFYAKKVFSGELMRCLIISLNSLQRSIISKWDFPRT